MRIQPRPRWRVRASVRFAEFADAVSAARAVAQAGLYPANCRVLDRWEATLNGVTTDGSSVLLLGFESSDHPLEAWIERALALCFVYGGIDPDGPIFREESREATRIGGAQGALADRAIDPAIDRAIDPAIDRAIDPAVDPAIDRAIDLVVDPAVTRSSETFRGRDTPVTDAASSWRAAFLDGPYLQSALISLGVLADTFETAITWDRFDALHADLTSRLRAALKRVCGTGVLTCRFTHVYPDGPAPYYTFMGPACPGQELEQWREIKQIAADVLQAHGATITHHHAVGRLHRPWYDQQRPELFAQSLRAVKASLDPAGILNPGVLIDP